MTDGRRLVVLGRIKKVNGIVVTYKWEISDEFVRSGRIERKQEPEKK
jgi:hypothetical protein